MNKHAVSLLRPRAVGLAGLVSLGSLALSGCMVDDDLEPADEVAQLPGVWQDLGPARLSAEPSIDRQDVDGAMSGETTPAPVRRPGDPVVIRAVNLHEQRDYSITFEASELEELSATARRLGLDRGSVPPEAAADEVIHLGWSDDHDSRVRFTNTTSWPFRAIGTLFDGGDCTGTRIGPRHVLTAAHCIYNKAAGTWNTVAFKPGRNGAASAPYGSSGPHWYWVPQEYIDLPATTSGFNGWDIGLIILDEAVGNGWMGYGAYSSSHLDAQDVFMRGYPMCDTTGEPEDCAPKTLWGDVKVCELGTYFNTDGDGWSREIKTNCDGSAGQSGSSFYFYNGAGAPVSFGVFSGHYCLAGCPDSPNSAWPNVITRITPEYLGVINGFRAAYPE